MTCELETIKHPLTVICGVCRQPWLGLLLVVALLPQIGGYWSSGLPYLDASYKATKRPWEAGLQLPLMMLNITDLQVRMYADAVVHIWILLVYKCVCVCPCMETPLKYMHGPAAASCLGDSATVASLQC